MKKLAIKLFILWVLDILVFIVSICTQDYNGYQLIIFSLSMWMIWEITENVEQGK